MIAARHSTHRRALPVLTGLLLSVVPMRAQLLTNLKSFPERVSVGDPLTASNDLKEGPKGIATADFNGDGKPDLAVGNLDGTITVLISLDGGKFEAPRHVRTGALELRSVLAADLNGDGRPDLAAASPMDGKLLVYFNAGGANFPAATVLPGWTGVRSLASGDFDGDGKLDLAAAGPGLGVRHFRGTGGGAFDIMGDLPRLSPFHAELPRPVYALRTLRSRDGLRDDLLVTHADSAALWILSTVPVNRSSEPAMNLNRLPGWKTLASPVLLNEVQVHNATTVRDADGTMQPWVELMNKSAAPINLAGWTLKLDAASWTFPPVTVASGRMLTVFLSAKNRTGAELHTSFLLKQNSVVLGLYQPNAVLANQFTLAWKGATDVSYGLAPDLNAAKYFDIPSPGAENNAGLNKEEDINQDTLTTLTITPRHPAPGQSVTVRVTMPERLTGTSSVRYVWFSATPGLYEEHHLLHRKSPGVYEGVLPVGSFAGNTPHHVLARLWDGTGNDYTSEIHRGLDEAESSILAAPKPGRLLPVASVPSPKVKAFETGAVLTPANLPGAPADLVYADDVCGLLRVHRAGPGARRFEPMPSQDIAVRGAPRDVKLADTDGDGWLDATVVLRSLDLAMICRNENGVLRAIGELPTGRSPREAVMADFNSDGKPDAAVINRYSADVSILPSSATHAGLVSLDQIYPVNGEVSGLLVKDTNGDGRDDVMQLHRASGEISIRTAGPDGTLSAPVFRTIGGQSPGGMATADVNNDGLTDMLSANLGWGGNGSISVLLAKADGTFEAARTLSSGGGMFAIAIADFDKDGNQDVVAGLFDCRVAFFRGNGTGSFTPTYSVFFAYESRVMVTGDFDQDGDIDIAGAGNAGDMVTLENLGAVTAAGWSKRIYPASPGAYGTYRIAISTVNSDDDPDLILGTGHGSAVYTGGTGMSFNYATDLSLSVSFAVSDFLTKDLDGDGKLEMVAACRAASCVNILTQNAAGEFTLVTQADVPSGKFLGTGDLDGDGKPDLVGTGDALWTVLSSRPAQAAAAGIGDTGRPQTSEVVINEVLPQNTGVPLSVDNGKKSDFVEIYNGSSGPVVLTGWKVRLQSVQDGLPMDQTWTLPATTAGAKGHALIVFSAEPGPTHTGFTLPAEGGTVTLLRPDNSTADSVIYPKAWENVSWSRYLDGHPTFHADRIPSPGMSNLDNGAVPPEVKLTPPSSATMVAGQPLKFTAHGSDDAGIMSLSLLWNRLDAPLSAPQRIVLYDDGMHQDGPAVDGFFAGLLAPGLPAGAEVQFYLEAVDLSGETVLLPDSAELVSAGEAPVAWSFSLTTAPALEISEVSSNNTTMVRDELGGHSDFVRIRNTGVTPLDLFGILLAKSPLAGSTAVFSFPPGLMLPAGGEITVYADNNPAQGALHAPFTLDAGGDDLALLAVTPSGARQWIHSLSVPASTPDTSYRRLPGTDLRAVLAATADPNNWSGIATDATGAALATVRFPATAGTTWLIEGDAPGAPVEWSPLQTVAGDGTVHTITWPVADMASLRAVAIPALPSVRVDAVLTTATVATVMGEAPRATEVTVFYGISNGGTNPAAWSFSQTNAKGVLEINLPSLTASTLHWYRVRAKNAAGEIWSGADTWFDTLPAAAAVPSTLTLTQLNPSDARVQITINPAPPPGSGVTLLAGTVDAFQNTGAWQRRVPAVLSAQNTWTASLTGLSRETAWFARAVLTTPDSQIVSMARLSFRTPDARENLVRNLRLSEIMYNPPLARTSAELAAGFVANDFEYIELQNASTHSMDLSGLWFENGLDFAFPLTGALILPPGGFAVIAANPHAFAMRYGTSIPLAGWTLHPFRSARLANSGEKITLRTADGTVLFDIFYEDIGLSDGYGFSLDLKPSFDPNRPEDYQDYIPSRVTAGTPGRAPLPPPGQSFMAWQSFNFTTVQLNNPALSGMNADPDKDGLTNLAEYACGTSPLIPGSKDMLSISDGGVIDGAKTLFLTFPMSLMAKEALFEIQGKDRTLASWNLDVPNIAHYADGQGVSMFQGNWITTSNNYLWSAVLSPNGQQILFTIAVTRPFGLGDTSPANFGMPSSRLFRLKITRPTP